MKLVELHIKPMRYAAILIGGLLFGVGFALIGYCPGTGAAALGQGNYDAIAGIFGLLAGSYLYAEYSAQLGKTVETWGKAKTHTASDTSCAHNRIHTRVRAVLAAILLALDKYFPGR